MGLGAGVVCAALGLAVILSPFGNEFERTQGLDWLFKTRGKATPPPGVAVVGINNRTGRMLDLARLPRDWPRSTHGMLVERLVARGADIIVFDMDFSRAKPGDEDADFARAITSADRVVLFEWLSAHRERLVSANGQDAGWTWVEEKRSPTPVLAEAASAIGPFPLPKIDQAATEFWTFKSSLGDNATIPALALQMKALPYYETWIALLGQAGASGLDALPATAEQLRSPDDIKALMQAFRGIFVNDPSLAERVGWRIDAQPDDKQRQLLAALATLYGGPDHYFLNFYGPPGSIPTIPYEDVLSDDRAPAPGTTDLAGTVVFIGYSDLFAPDQPDRFFTSFTGDDGVDLSGVEIMATAFSNLLTQGNVRPVALRTEIAIIVAFGLVAGLSGFLLPATAGVPTVIGLAVLYGVFAQWRFNETSVWLPLATPALVQMPCALLIGLIGQYRLKRHAEQQVTRAISMYLPENIVQDLTQREFDPSEVNKVVYGTCLATDMSGFTTLSETKKPEELAEFMNSYFDELATALKRHDVDITEFHADTIMCAWTSAEPSPEVCAKAVGAALDVCDAIERFAAQRGRLRLNPRIGLQDGYFYVGHTGGGGRMAYSILGDTANTAARLESLNKYLGTHVLAAETVLKTPDGLLVRPLGDILLSGKADATPVVEIIAKSATATDRQMALCSKFSTALTYFREKDWVTAEQLFETIRAEFGDDGPSQFYLSYIRGHKSSAPTFDGPAFVKMTEK
ncbi:CHASE2 domain-containing protein [Microbaculum marinisediminis]|uniref:Adenylate/guanylate cyclase domain-containing protein n=1 Tax=Microbaculum marinisediminis TaxID=2931392 RepID=A0AAW5R3U6_9HYPH|nr:adenylate/guanylate cyclase domain-containing protein [Microbaculum sp. A6E488]MCT8973351.1 adenylate/guanylate cyclase domain-containing protein [Microbaculum sp. A6E488]